MPRAAAYIPADARPAATSTLPVQVPATFAIRPGWMWTGGVLRVGAVAHAAATAGLLDDAGEPVKIKDVNEHATLTRLRDHVLDAMWDMWEHRPFPELPADQWRILIAVTDYPPRVKGAPRPSFLRLHIPATITAALTGMFPAARLVDPRGPLGMRHRQKDPATRAPMTGDAQDYYPPNLIGARPEAWPPSDDKRNARIPEQAAYDLAAAPETGGVILT